jgi:AmiR/NasT family two-component response regulator
MSLVQEPRRQEIPATRQENDEKRRTRQTKEQASQAQNQSRRRASKAKKLSIANIELVAEAACFADAIRMAAELKPDVVLIDLHMRDEREFDPASTSEGSAQVTAVIHRILRPFSARWYQ